MNLQSNATWEHKRWSLCVEVMSVRVRVCVRVTWPDPIDPQPTLPCPTFYLTKHAKSPNLYFCTEFALFMFMSFNSVPSATLTLSQLYHVWLCGLIMKLDVKKQNLFFKGLKYFISFQISKSHQKVVWWNTFQQCYKFTYNRHTTGNQTLVRQKYSKTYCANVMSY